MPYTFSDVATQAILNFVHNLGPMSELNLLRSVVVGEVQQQEAANVSRGLLPNGVAKPAEDSPSNT